MEPKRKKTILFLFILDSGIVALLEAVSDEHDTVLDEARDSHPELAVDDVVCGTLRLLELPLVDSTKDKVKDKKANKAIKNNIK